MEEAPRVEMRFLLRREWERRPAPGQSGMAPGRAFSQNKL
jgi:hypothetical protein